LAGGRTTDDELKKDARERKRKSREKKKEIQKKKLPEPEPKPISVTTPRVTESPEISAEQRRRENEALAPELTASDGSVVWATMRANRLRCLPTGVVNLESGKSLKRPPI